TLRVVHGLEARATPERRGKRLRAGRPRHIDPAALRAVHGLEARATSGGRLRRRWGGRTRHDVSWASALPGIISPLVQAFGLSCRSNGIPWLII
ncbi:MAG: hypothetical protein LBK99_19570, partial [Opitutaceae bacterium]|nr:hypothetical protein [Opitutaceae bacterium]